MFKHPSISFRTCIYKDFFSSCKTNAEFSCGSRERSKSERKIQILYGRGEHHASRPTLTFGGETSKQTKKESVTVLSGLFFSPPSKNRKETFLFFHVSEIQSLEERGYLAQKNPLHRVTIKKKIIVASILHMPTTRVTSINLKLKLLCPANHKTTRQLFCKEDTPFFFLFSQKKKKHSHFQKCVMLPRLGPSIRCKLCTARHHHHRLLVRPSLPPPLRIVS